ncbi:transposase, partial [Ferrovum sp.]|uniref:transposase n=1 Tax=Ferrovum sp. TaxID=2609467 RepID=UPI002618AC9C
AGTEIEPFRWLNVVLGNLKTALSGTYHAFNFRKYAGRYLAESQYRFNRRFDLAAMVPRLAVALMSATPCSGKKLMVRTEIET